MAVLAASYVYGVMVGNGGLVGGGEGEVGEDEAVDVDPLVDDFGDGLAGAVAGSKSTTLKLQTTG